MRATGIALGSQAGGVLALLREWPALQAAEPYCRTGVGVAVGSCQILHLHTGDEAELCLTRPAICRMYPALAGTDRVVLGRSEDWIGLHLETARDADLLLSLLSVAIKTCLPLQRPRMGRRQAVTECSVLARGRTWPEISEDREHARRPLGIARA